MKLTGFEILTGIDWFVMLLILCITCFPSCQEGTNEVQSKDHLEMTGDSLVKYNHEVVVAESQEIEDFILRYHWKMKTTQTGLRWMIYKAGKGDVMRQGDTACIKYTVSLINGDVIYRTGPQEQFDFVTGKARVPNGLEEAILFMKTGDCAKLILPSHLAFGLLGDQNKIKNRAILVYDVELYRIKPRNH